MKGAIELYLLLISAPLQMPYYLTASQVARIEDALRENPKAVTLTYIA